MQQNIVKSKSILALKAGAWYTVGNVLIRGVNFLSTPIFTRLMPKADYGLFANYMSWISFLTILTPLNLSSSIARAKIDFGDQLDDYIYSIQVLGTVSTILFYLIVCWFSDFFVSILQVDMLYIHILFIYLMIYPSFTLLQEKHRQELKYKFVTTLTIISTLLSMFCSIFLVNYLDDKFLGRVLGGIVVLTCFSAVIYIYNILKGSKIKLAYWKYGLAFSLPLIAHSLAGSVLATSDKVIITYFCGSESTALYSVVYSCASILFMVGFSVNQAWVPWFYEKLRKKGYTSISQATKIYLKASVVFLIITLLLGPELIYFFGGKAYEESVYILPPIMIGCYFWILYTFFINVQLYHKKTVSIAIKTIIAAALNVSLNYFFIDKFGYQAAAYTTLICYMILFLLHGLSALKLGANKYFDVKLFIRYIIYAMSLMELSLSLYDFQIARYIMVALISVGIVFFFSNNRKKFLDIMK